MNRLNWLVSRLVAAVIVGAVVILLVYLVLFPAVLSIVARTELPIDEFLLDEGESVSGSDDAVYYAARYSCAGGTVTRITAKAPDAQYWMIGIYDNRLMRIPGGHLNDSTVDIDEDGNFTVVIQSLPGNHQNTLNCYKGRSGVMIYRVFLPEDRDAVEAPTIERSR